MDERDATRENVERKQARTVGENEDDDEEPQVRLTDHYGFLLCKISHFQGGKR